MSGFTTYMDTSIINHFFRNSNVASPVDVYLGLFTTYTDINGGGTEVVGGGYARQVINFSAPVDGFISNTGALLFPNIPICTVVSGGIFDAVAGGNMLLYGSLSAARLVAVVSNFVIGINEVSFRVR